MADQPVFLERPPFPLEEGEYQLWKAQYERAHRLMGRLVQYRPPYNAEALGMPTEPVVGVVLEVTGHSMEWGPMVRLGFGPLEKKPGASFPTYKHTRTVPIATCRALKQVEEVISVG